MECGKNVRTRYHKTMRFKNMGRTSHRVETSPERNQTRTSRHRKFGRVLQYEHSEGLHLVASDQ